MANNQVPAPILAPIYRLRFAVSDDIHLLREVAAENPLSDPVKWWVVTCNVNASTGKTLTQGLVPERLIFLFTYVIKKGQQVKQSKYMHLFILDISTASRCPVCSRAFETCRQRLGT